MRRHSDSDSASDSCAAAGPEPDAGSKPHAVSAVNPSSLSDADSAVNRVALHRSFRI